MFQKEVIDYLKNISKKNFKQVYEELREFEVRVERIRVSGKIQFCKKYDRMKIYNIEITINHK